MESLVFFIVIIILIWGFAVGKTFGVRPKSRRTARNLPTTKSQSSAPNPTPRCDTLTGRAHVIDGDTIVISGQHIRLFGIDAPELDHPYGKKSKWALVGLCKDQVIRAEFNAAQSYNREVAICYLPDGRDLSEEMVRLGMAIDWPKFSGGKYRQFETPDARRKLWRAAARQKGLMPPPQR